MKFTIADSDTLDSVTRLVEPIVFDLLLHSSAGEYEIKRISQKRSDKLNRTIHAIFTEVADTMNEHGLTNRLTIKAAPTTENMKVFFKEKFLNGKKTSETTNKELSEALDLFLHAFNDFFASKGIETVHVQTEELKQLLNDA